jgi:hypothetical protein
MKITASTALVIAGLLSAACTLFGFIAFLGLGFPSSLVDALLELGLIAGLPLYLVGLRSLRWSALLLLLQFGDQWLSSSLVNGSFQPVNPLGAWEYIATLATACMVGFASFTVPPRDGEDRDPRLGDAFRYVEDSF